MRPSLRTHGAVALTAVAVLALSACGAGSKTTTATATQVTCDVPKPSSPTTVNVLAYNSSAIDPFTNTMVSSCSKNDYTLKHEPIDFPGQVQKTTATLAGASGTYDIVETYGFVIPQYGSQGKLAPLDDLFAKHADAYKLNDISKDMRAAMTYDGKLYALPMQAQMYIMAYRKDVFDQVGLKPPTTFEELKSAAKTIQDKAGIKYPIALPWLATADIVTSYDCILGSLGTNLTNFDTKTANFDKPQAKQALEEMLALKPYMDPQVTTFAQPAVQQQMYNGTAAIAIMFSGRMNDLTLEKNSKFAKNFAFAPPPKVAADSPKLYDTLSVDGWSIPNNTALDKDALFQMIASSVSVDASKASLPAAYPARTGMVSDTSSPYAAAANVSITSAPPAEPYPWTAEVSNKITPIIANVVLGKATVDDGVTQMQQAATAAIAAAK
jgi:multiple sugar transport system substrate-binding protein